MTSTFLNLRILHDFDNPYPSGRWALKRGISLILYAISRWVPPLQRWCSEVYLENYEYAKTLAQLDVLLGIHSLFGINRRVIRIFPNLRRDLLGMDIKDEAIVDHWHVSAHEVHWHPTLIVPKEDWFFDQDWSKGRRILPSGQYAVFHADYPYLLSSYIDFLWKKANRK